MRSYRIVLEYTDALVGQRGDRAEPQDWDWYEVLGGESGVAVSVVNVEEIPTPEGHKEDLQDA